MFQTKAKEDEGIDVIVHEVNFVKLSPDNPDEDIIYSAYFLAPDTVDKSEKQTARDAEEINNVKLKNGSHNEVKYYEDGTHYSGHYMYCDPDPEGAYNHNVKEKLDAPNMPLTNGQFCNIVSMPRKYWRDSEISAKAEGSMFSSLCGKQDGMCNVDDSFPELKQSAENFVKTNASEMVGEDVKFLDSRVCTARVYIDDSPHSWNKGSVKLHSVCESHTHPEGISTAQLKEHCDNMTKVNDIIKEKQDTAKRQNAGRRFLSAVGIGGVTADAEKTDDVQYN